MPRRESAESTQPSRGTGFASALKSAAAAAFGVQSQANRERDFSQGKPIHFIVAGIIATLLFILGVILFVKIMLATGS